MHFDVFGPNCCEIGPNCNVFGPKYYIEIRVILIFGQKHYNLGQKRQNACKKCTKNVVIWAKNIIIWANNVFIWAQNVENLGQKTNNLGHGFGPKNNRIWAKFGVLAVPKQKEKLIRSPKTVISFFNVTIAKIWLLIR